MRAPVPFGQYVPIDSPIHVLDPRTKMGLMAGMGITLFTIEGFTGLGVIASMLLVVIALSRVPLHLVTRGLKAVTLLLSFTLLAHALRWEPATVALLRLGPLAIDQGGLLQGLFFSARIVILVLGSTLLTLTSSPVEITDGLTRIMRPLERLRIPVGDIAMMLTIALRFIPTMAEEAEKIMVAQIARGARFDQRWPISRARAYIPILIPLFVNLFKRAEALAIAMEARCYVGGYGRTRLHQSSMTKIDISVLLGACLAFAVIAVTL
ncbi:MAG: energy-coupling factor transporter transmembrane protein EcfT [Actinobacteria bacterium]|nr:energy-coupling factor transporter transmembrane protein EcfT [Actinomycetota bacterium]MCL5887156.1 energy-coupling factor transporter transmembrane protein EcfT [Actinomycetota bacterium]